MMMWLIKLVFYIDDVLSFMMNFLIYKYECYMISFNYIIVIIGWIVMYF